MDALKMLRKFREIDAAELQMWREMYPKSAAGVREEAAAKVEMRDPKHAPVRAYL